MGDDPTCRGERLTSPKNGDLQLGKNTTSQGWGISGGE